MSGATPSPATWAPSPSTSGVCAKRSSATRPTRCFCKRSGAWAISWEDLPDFGFTILDFGFTICSLSIVNPKSKIQNVKMQTAIPLRRSLAPFGLGVLIAFGIALLLAIGWLGVRGEDMIELARYLLVSSAISLGCGAL